MHSVFHTLYLLRLTEALWRSFCAITKSLLKTNYVFNMFTMSAEFIKHWIFFITHQLNLLSFVMCLCLGDITKVPSLETVNVTTKAYVSKTIICITCKMNTKWNNIESP